MNATMSDTKTTRTICGYCGVGCSLDLVTRDNRIIAVHPAFDGPANQGALCVKGQFAYDYVHHPGQADPSARARRGGPAAAGELGRGAAAGRAGLHGCGTEGMDATRSTVSPPGVRPAKPTT